MAKAIIAIFFPSFFFLSVSPCPSRKPIPKIPITITMMATTEVPEITLPRIATDKIEVIAPDVFSIGSEIDSSIKRMPKNDNAMDTM